MTTVTSKLVQKLIGCDRLELVKGKDYWYFVYDDAANNVYDTESVIVVRLNHMGLEQWCEIGREFVAKMEKRVADLAEAKKAEEDEAAKSTLVNTQNNIAGGLSHRLGYEAAQKAVKAGELYILGPQLLARITGWSTTARTQPLICTRLAKAGDPCAPATEKARTNAMLGIRASLTTTAHVQPGDLAYLDYTPDEPDQADDQPGFYAVRIVSATKSGATITFANVPDAGKHRYKWTDLIIVPADPKNKV